MRKTGLGTNPQKLHSSTNPQINMYILSDLNFNTTNPLLQGEFKSDSNSPEWICDSNPTNTNPRIH